MKKVVKSISSILLMSFVLSFGFFPGSIVRAEENSKIINLEQNESEQSEEAEPENNEENVEAEPKTVEVSEPEGKKIKFTVESNIFLIDGQEYPLTNSPKILKGRTYLPLRAVVGQVLEAAVKWEKETQQIFITKKNAEIILTIGKDVAMVNGIEKSFDAPALLEKGTTLVPLRFLAEQFNIKVDYDALTQTINLTVPKEKPKDEITENNPPIAKFRFDQESYIAGQPVGTIDMSIDEDGDQIVDTLWQIDQDEKVVAKTLSSMFRTPRPGTYKISYKVMDSQNLWSDWYTEEITILPNEKPIVTELTTEQEEYGRGEKINFSYKYENESWEKIKDEKWTYRPQGVKESTMTPLKPEAIYAQGEYIVTLQVQDEYGNYSDKKEVVVKVNDILVKSEFEHKISQGKIGETIDNFQGFNMTNLKEATLIKKEMEDGKLIMSDSPEMVKEKGILYKETVWGKGRMLIHHINKFAEEEAKARNKRLVVTATNNANIDVELNVWNKTVRGPSEDVFYLGQQLLFHYFKGAPAELTTIKPGATEIIYDNGTRKWLTEQTISGMFDFSTSLPLTFTVAVLDQEDTVEAIESMENLPKDIHPRGTFNTLTQAYHLDLTEETEAVKFQLGKGTAEWLEGIDGITREKVYNRGNYGMVYKIKVTAKEDTAMLINPRGYSFRGAIRWEGDDTYNIPGAGNYTGSTNRAAFAGLIPAGESREFSYMLPNGSASPVLFAFVPKSKWNQFLTE